MARQLTEANRFPSCISGERSESCEMRAKGRLSLTGGGVELDVRRLLNDRAAPDLKAVAQQLEGGRKRDGSGAQAGRKWDRGRQHEGSQFKWERGIPGAWCRHRWRSLAWLSRSGRRSGSTRPAFWTALSAWGRRGTPECWSPLGSMLLQVWPSKQWVPL